MDGADRPTAMNPPRLLLIALASLSLPVALTHCERTGDNQPGKPEGHGSGVSGWDENTRVDSPRQEVQPEPNSPAGAAQSPATELDEEEP